MDKQTFEEWWEHHQETDYTQHAEAEQVWTAAQEAMRARCEQVARDDKLPAPETTQEREQARWYNYACDEIADAIAALKAE